MQLPAFAGLAPLSIRARTSEKPNFAPRMSASSHLRVLVVNTKSGGHAVLGPHLAEQLLFAGHTVTVLQLGSAASASPFTARYPSLSTAFPSSFTLEHAPSFAASPLANPSAPAFDAVYDNASKSPNDALPTIAAGKAGAEVFYVSSAGAYKYNPALAPHLTGDAAAGPTVDTEQAMAAYGVLTAAFRPIYVTGPGSDKREYTDWFFDRIARGRPLVIPGCGEEFTSISDARDVASLMVCALAKRDVLDKGVVINAVSTR
jgi:nucleoside-diphosphate-sugar epimerase